MMQQVTNEPTGQFEHFHVVLLKSLIERILLIYIMELQAMKKD